MITLKKNNNGTFTIGMSEFEDEPLRTLLVNYQQRILELESRLNNLPAELQKQIEATNEPQ